MNRECKNFEIKNPSSELVKRVFEVPLTTPVFTRICFSQNDEPRIIANFEFIKASKSLAFMGNKVIYRDWNNDKQKLNEQVWNINRRLIMGDKPDEIKCLGEGIDSHKEIVTLYKDVIEGSKYRINRFEMRISHQQPKYNSSDNPLSALEYDGKNLNLTIKGNENIQNWFRSLKLI